MKKQNSYKIQKQLRKEIRHKAWLEKNLSNTTALKKSRKRVLELYTELAFKWAE